MKKIWLKYWYNHNKIKSAQKPKSANMKTWLMRESINDKMNMKEASNSKQINLWAYQIHHLIFKLLQKIKSNRSIQTSPYLCFTHKVLINRKSIFKSDLFFHYSITITFFFKTLQKHAGFWHKITNFMR